MLLQPGGHRAGLSLLGYRQRVTPSCYGGLL
jgi:hypothetical protein